MSKRKSKLPAAALAYFRECGKMGARNGADGGNAAAANMTPVQRSERAKRGWEKRRKAAKGK